MGNISPEKIRNVVIAGHGGSGKTLLAESILYTTGATNRLGKIEDGSTTSDYSKDQLLLPDLNRWIYFREFICALNSLKKEDMK